MYTQVGAHFDLAASFDTMSRGQWFRTPDGALYLECPKCSVRVKISCPPHVVRVTGMVFPSWVCPQKCGFHSVIRLRGFIDEWVKRHPPVQTEEANEIKIPNCLTCDHLHQGPCQCGCISGTPAGEPQPIFYSEPSFRPLIGVVRDGEKTNIIVGVGAEEVVYVALPIEHAEAFATQILSEVTRARSGHVK